MRKALTLLLLVTLTLLMATPVFANGLEEAVPASMTALKAEDPAQASKMIPDFDPEKTDYVMYVQADVYGVRLTPEFAGAQSAVVYMSGDGIDSSVQKITSGESIVLNLTQLQSMYRQQVASTAVFSVGDKTYTFMVVREDGSYLYDDFDLKEYRMANGKYMNYWLYVPDDYSPSKKYPVVLYLHGGGQSNQAPEMILQRTLQAASFIRYGYDECIIVAPHNNYTDMTGNSPGWANRGADGQSNAELSPFGQAAFDILQSVKREYSADRNRIYVTGGSMGGAGTLTMVASHPEEFAAGLAACGGTDLTALVSALKREYVPLWLVQAVEDPVVPYQKHLTNTAALKEAGIPFNETVYGSDVFLYPNAHFSWEPSYANKEILAWMFCQSKANKEGELIDLKFEESTQLEKLVFNPAVTEYQVTVQSDIYGIRLTPYGTGSFTINGLPVKGGESFEMAFSEDMQDYRKQLEYKIEVKSADKTYSIKVKREDGSYLFDAFDLKTYTLKNGKQMYYWLSVPKNYDPSKEYPVVMCLHGGGQTNQAPEMILYRCLQAAAIVKGGYEAIIIAPQNNYTDLSGAETNEKTGLTTTMEGAYQILQMVKDMYSVNDKRIYLTGLSAGGVNSEIMLSVYPKEFAAGLLVATGLVMKLSDYDKMAQSNVPVRLVVHIDDSAHISGGTLQIVQKMRSLGMDSEAIIYPSTMYLSTRPHFSWIAAYADRNLLDWMFSQVNN